MTQALKLARESIGQASPNPQVGCVLVRDGILLGQGAHHYANRDHAEIVALKQAAAAGHTSTEATAYVTLEPCSHHGRTGPCTDALIAAGIARCVVATTDPNPAVSGSGLAKMRAAGIEVLLGPGKQAARELNNAFAFFIQHQRPFVSLKAALSKDGRLAPAASSRQPNQPFWLTGPESRAEVQRLRHASDAILTGIGTVLADNPALTDRTGLPRRRPLQRIVVDSRLRIPLNCILVQTALERHATTGESDLWIFTTAASPPDKRTHLANLGVRITVIAESGEHGRIDLANVVNRLHDAQILSVLLEAGSALNGAFLDQKLVDRLILFYAPIELGPTSLAFAGEKYNPFDLESVLSHRQTQQFGPDACMSGLLHDPWIAEPD